MNQERLWLELERVASRYRRLRYWSALAAAWLIAAMVAFLAWGLGRSAAGSPHLSAPFLCLVAVSLAGLAVWMAALLAPRRPWVARRVAATFPELRNCLLAAVEQRPALPDGRFGFLQSSVIDEAVDHARQHAWQEVVPQRRIRAAAVTQFAAFALFLTGLTATALSTAPPAVAGSASAPERGAAAAGYSVTVEPGDVEIEKGTSLLVLARVKGQMPAEAALVYQSTGSEAVQLPMPLSLNDPVFGTRIAIVNEPLEYHVELDGHSTPTYHVTVFEYPRLERADARLVYPKYAGMEERLVQDVRTVSVVEGTEVTLICRLNKPVATARSVESAKIPPLELAAIDGEPNVYQTTFRPEKSRRLKLHLTDDAGRKNTQISELAIHVVPNQAPVLKPIFPARDMEVSALEELDLKFTAFDDFGLIRAGVSYGLAAQPPVDIVLAENAAARTRHELGHTVRLEDLHAEPDQLLSYYFWSEDYGPDGAVRRTSSDMYFAEVRPWEEIYRQGEQPAGGEQAERERQQRERQQGQGENVQRAEQLAKLQKDIINATWKLIRRETGPKPTTTFATDAEQIEQSQNSAREKAEGMAERLQDSESLVHLAAVLDQMEKAASHLKTAHEEPSAAPLPQALAAEQSAYQSLLKLRAREFQVIRQQRQQSASANSSQSPRSEQQRRQMEQLQLQNEENRYETQRMAQSQSPREQQEERETRQVLNRLNELARRQHDLNERLKDLQSALAEAATPQEREEARRQLQRLQEEQQQVLRDTEELQSRMDTPENQERMAQERQQLEQTRDQVQRASESMQEERVSQAAASGTRAERDFEELRNEFRRRAAGRFGEEVRQMRDDARELDRREQNLAERLKQVTNPDPAEKSLRDDGQRERIQQDLSDQRKRLGDLTERMRQTIQDAEQTEPLLSERLYDAARNVQNQNPDRALQAAEGSVRRGLSDDARQQEEIAGRSIRQLREGVERAAESVLGDETEALRRARDELRQLADELNQEVARNSGDDRQSGADGEQPDRQQDGARNARGQRDQAGEEGAQPGERQGRGERQAGERQTSRQRGEGDQPRDQQAEDQPGERQRGEGQPGRGQRQGQRGEGQRGERRTAQQPGNGQPGERQSERAERGGQNGRGQPGDDEQDAQSQNADATDAQQPVENSRAGQRPGQRARQEGAGRQRGDRQNSRRPQPGQGGAEPGDRQDQQANQPGERDGQGRTGERRQGQRGGQQGGRRVNNPTGPGGFAPFDEFDPELAAPLTGNNFLDWSDRLRDVEEMVDDPELRAEAARIRDRARALRAEFKRHSVAPNWDLVKVKVATPLAELRDRVSDELLRRTAKQANVPLDRDPVPPRYSEKTRRYYENLGSGK
jgi:hypothetical protein